MYIVSDGNFTKIYSNLTEKEIEEFGYIHCITILHVTTPQATAVIRVYEVDQSGNEIELKETPR